MIRHLRRDRPTLVGAGLPPLGVDRGPRGTNTPTVTVTVTATAEDEPPADATTAPPTDSPTDSGYSAFGESYQWSDGLAITISATDSRTATSDAQPPAPPTTDHRRGVRFQPSPGGSFSAAVDSRGSRQIVGGAHVRETSSGRAWATSLANGVAPGYGRAARFRPCMSACPARPMS